ncbi:putative protein family UPF0183 [Ascosphaera apis ARSEF 7405]|uniref:Uncharacterized protein n=1 Tax=Ascosphaera apis ARSEF 7405 TaxID=392613 RepID=A0A167VJD2_9EURO|nr:putative protein family UPF0183 [Ascosphaera apis ARSEF 7405]
MAPSTQQPPPQSPIYPGKSLSFLTLGSSLHNILTRIKALPHIYPSIELTYSPAEPVSKPILITLPDNGVRLRFDGPDQRLRLIEVLEHGFSRMAVTYKGHEVVKPGLGSRQSTNPQGPSFKQVYHRLFGPSYPGEYIPPSPSSSSKTHGTYILSYPGVAFSFPLLHSTWSDTCDFVSLLASSAALPATAMSIFSGLSWAEARAHLYNHPPPLPRSACLLAPGPGSSSTVAGGGTSSPSVHSKQREKDYLADEVEQVIVHGGGKINVIRRSGSSFWIRLSETTPQDLVAELGPPDAIYRRPDRRIAIHKHKSSVRGRSSGRARSESTVTTGTVTTGTSLGSADIGLSSETGTLNSDDKNDADSSDDIDGLASEGKEISEECFYNYFHHGFDIFISYPKISTSPSFTCPSSDDNGSTPTHTPISAVPQSTLTATKILIHGNIPGSYPFNRHRRCQWTLALPSESDQLDSETPYPIISSALRTFFRPYYASPEDEELSQVGMGMNRGWGESSGSSVNLFGDWEDGEGERTVTGVDDGGGGGNGDTNDGKCNKASKTDTHVHVLGNTQLFGFPGLLFEVLKNGAVSCLTVY